VRPCLRIAALLLLAATTTVGAPGAAAGVEAEARASATAARAQTLATIPASVRHFAHDGRYLVWLTGDVDPRCTLRVWFHDLRSGARTGLSGCRGRDNCCDVSGLAVAGGRAYWTQAYRGNTYSARELRSVSPRDRRVRELAYQGLYRDYSLPHGPPVSDGRSVYFWTTIRGQGDGGDPGPVVRFEGTRRTRLTPPVRLWGLAAGGGRLAVAENAQELDCAREPAWSPDGQRIAFSRSACSAGLWVMAADGSALRRIAGSGRNPDWAPDGSRLAFDDGGAIVVVDADGRNRRMLVAAGTDPAWSPDSTLLAFTRNGSILVVNADGSGERLVTSPATAPDWSPDGTRLVFARPATPRPSLGIVDLDGSGDVILTTTASNRVGKPAWSPDGRLIAYESGSVGTGGEIWIVAPDGSGRRAVTAVESLAHDSHGPAWAPDSRRLAYAESHSEVDQGDTHIFVETLGGPRSRRKLTSTPTLRTPLVVRSRTGRVLARIEPGGVVAGVAVTARTASAVVRVGPSRRLEIYAPRRRTVALPRTPAPTLVGGSGTTLVLRLGRDIYAVDARTGRRRLLARAEATPIGLSIAGRRVAWAENSGGRAYVRAVEVPR
jgi:Tol biopolymer transport system component